MKSPEVCAKCGKPVGKVAAVSLVAGGLVCLDCLDHPKPDPGVPVVRWGECKKGGYAY